MSGYALEILGLSIVRVGLRRGGLKPSRRMGRTGNISLICQTHRDAGGAWTASRRGDIFRRMGLRRRPAGAILAVRLAGKGR